MYNKDGHGRLREQGDTFGENRRYNPEKMDERLKSRTYFVLMEMIHEYLRINMY